MSRRWLACWLAMLFLALLAFLPLRVALATSELERIGFGARQVAGTIWYGRIGDLQLRSRPLGTFEVAVDPASLLLGSPSMRMNRLDGTEGPLEGIVRAGRQRGIARMNGRIAAQSLFSPLPIEALEFRDATLLFRDGLCAEASGTVVPVLAAPVPGVDLGSGLMGRLRCNGRRARVVMRDPNGAGRLDLYVDSAGAYRAWMSVDAPSPELSAVLVGLGFRHSSLGLTLSARGRL